MTLTAIDPRAALVLIDLQKGITAIPTAHPIKDVVTNAARLAEAFRARDLPVVFVTVVAGAPGRVEAPRASAGTRPDDWADLVEDLGRAPGDHLITKRTWGAFTGTGLDALLRGLGVTQVVLGGVSTSIGVESTGRQAHEHGYNVTLALDAMTDSRAESHDHSTTRIFPRLGETGSTEEVIALLPPVGE